MRAERLTRHRPLSPGHWPLFLILALLSLGAGCRLMRTATDVPAQAVRAVTPGKGDRKAVDPTEVQEALLRFADNYSTRMPLVIEKLRHGTNAVDPAEVLRLKIALTTETCAIASGANAIANLVDMTAFVTATRTTIEEYWEPKVFGESAQPILEISRNAEMEIWQLAGMVLNPKEQAALRQSIAEWCRQNPLPENVLGARALGFATRMAQANQASAAKAADSVFSLLTLDPFAGLDPATREIAQTRLFAERALFVTQRMPTLMRWQTELLSLTAVEMPAVQQLVSNSTQIAASADSFARTAEHLPKQISAEREEIMNSLQSQEKQLTPLVGEVRQTLSAGSQMSTSLNTTLVTFDALMKRFGVGETNRAGPPATNTPPFRILDYGETAVKLEAMARQLTELIRTLDQTLDSTNLAQLSAQVGPAVQQAQTSGKEVVDYAFWKGILLVAVVLVAALFYRFLALRMTAARSKGTSP